MQDYMEESPRNIVFKEQLKEMIYKRKRSLDISDDGITGDSNGWSFKQYPT